MITSNLILLILMISLLVFHPFSAPAVDGKLTVVFLDVGQGDSALITFPNGQTMLVDGGGKHNFTRLEIFRRDGESEEFAADFRQVGEAVVSEYLWERGYSSIDLLLSTHSDADHLQGLTTVIKNFSVKTAFVGSGAPENRDYSEFMDLAKNENVGVLGLSAGERIEIGGVLLEVLNPDSRTASKSGSSNNRSIVFRLIYGSKKILFTGDIEQETENELVKKPEYLSADIIKVAHHGSRTSSSPGFVNAAKPQYAVISVGNSSPFGHPHADVVGRWENAGARVMTTGERGTITISTNGRNLEVQTFIQP